MNRLNKSVRRRKGLRKQEFIGNHCPCSPDVGDCPHCHPALQMRPSSLKKTRKRRLALNTA